jgi:hypothetical protein
VEIRGVVTSIGLPVRTVRVGVAGVLPGAAGRRRELVRTVEDSWHSPVRGVADAVEANGGLGVVPSSPPSRPVARLMTPVSRPPVRCWQGLGYELPQSS